MKNSNFTFYENTILENINFEGYNFDKNMSQFVKIRTVYNCFKSEYLHKNNRHLGEDFLFSEWLRGLPTVLTVPFYNHEIIENGKKAGYSLFSEPSQSDFLENYWQLLAVAFFRLKNNL